MALRITEIPISERINSQHVCGIKDKNNSILGEKVREEKKDKVAFYGTIIWKVVTCMKIESFSNVSQGLIFYNKH